LKILRVGDPHAKIGNLQEMEALVGFIIEVAGAETVDRIEILGDLFHTHAVLRLEVIDFWTKALTNLAKVCETVVIEGNHDQSGDYSSDFSSLSVFSLMNIPNLIIVDKPIQLGVFAYVPYTHDPSIFISRAIRLADNGSKVLVCHQTIQGSKYESGIYAPDGIPTEQWADRFVAVISGHIHSEQEFGNIVYPGTARWDSVTDANRRKGIWLYEHDAAGKIISYILVSTEQVCSPIQSIQWREGESAPTWNEKVRMSVELIGSSTWIAQKKSELKGKCSIKATFTDTKRQERRNAGKGLEDFIKNMFVSTMDRDHLIKTAREYGLI
jgi:DNA repair exonuclease SbcCD nuclease subunit